MRFILLMIIIDIFNYQNIYAVRHSAEVGWLVGTLERNGQRGLLPENYVKFI